MSNHSAAELAAELGALRARRLEVKCQHEERHEEAEAARDELGRAIARGEDETRLQRLRDQARQLGEEVEGLARAIPLLDERIEEVKVAAEEAEGEEAASEADRLVADATDTIEALAGALWTAADELLPLVARTKQATEAAWAAEKRARALAGRSPLSSRTVKAWHGHPGLRDAVEALERFGEAASDRREGAA